MQPVLGTTGLNRGMFQKLMLCLYFAVPHKLQFPLGALLAHLLINQLLLGRLTLGV